MTDRLTRYTDRKTGREVAAYIDDRHGSYGFWFVKNGKPWGVQYMHNPEKFHARFQPA